MFDLGGIAIPAAAAPQLGDEQPPGRRNISLWDRTQMLAAIKAMDEQIQPIRGWRSRRSASNGSGPSSPVHSDSDSWCSSSDDEQLPYPSVDSLEVVGVRLIVPNSMDQLIRGLPEAGHVETLLRVSSDSSSELARLLRIPDNPWVLHASTSIPGDPCALYNRLTESWVKKLKITVGLLCLMRRQLHEFCQSCQEVEEQIFAEVARPSVKKLVEVARCFSDACWSAYHISKMRPIYDALVDVLHTIRDFPCSQGELISNDVDIILHGMMDSFKRILEGTTFQDDSETIHPATKFLKHALDFCSQHSDMVQRMIPSGGNAIHSDLIMTWASKIKEDSSFLLQGRQQIFLLNNTDFITCELDHLQGGSLSIELEIMLSAWIKQQCEEYLKCWAEAVSCLQGDSLNKPCRSSLDEFAYRFYDIYGRQKTWMVRPALKYELREKIVRFIVEPYNTFLHKLQLNPGWAKKFPSLKQLISCFGNTKRDITVDHMEDMLRNLFES